MGLLGSDRVVVGYDLGNEFSQISFSVSGSGKVETLSQVAGTEDYNIPTALCKRNGVNQWYYGREALRQGEAEQGILVENLLELALDGEPVLIEGESFDPVALLTLFFKRSLGLLAQVSSPDKISAMMITCEVLDARMLDVLRRMMAGARLKTDRIVFQNHMESYYSFMLRQPEELWAHGSVLLRRENGIRAYCMECNKRTEPKVVFIEERNFSLKDEVLLPEEESLRQELPDRELLEISREVCREKMVESVFLIGDGFDQEQMRESLRFLCRKRRVFQGNNLFSKGACMGMQERLDPGPLWKKYAFLGKDKLKANIGMDILRQGEASYYALLDAGVNWYEAGQELDFYLRDGNEITLKIMQLTENSGKLAQMVLEDLPGNVARLHASFYLEEENVLTVEVRDLGFGEIRPSSGRVWREKIELY